MIQRVVRKWKSSSLAMKGGIIIAMPVLAILLIAGVGILDIAGNAQARRDIETNVETRRALNAAAYEATSAWAEFSASALSNRPPDTEKIHSRFEKLDTQMASLIKLSTDSPQVASRLKELKDTLAELRENLERPSPLADPLLVEEKARKVITGLEEMYAEEQRVLTSRVADYSRARLRSFVLFLASILAGLLTGLIAAVAYLKGIVRRMEALGKYAEKGSEDGVLDPRLKFPDEFGRLAENIRMGTATARLREHEAHTAKARLEAVMENLISPLFIKDASGRYVYVNPAYCALHGVEEESIIGKTRFDLKDAEAAPRMRESDLRVLETGIATIQKDDSTIAGSHRTFLTVRFPIPGESEGAPSLLCAVATDITQYEEALRDLEAARTQLESKVSERTVELRQQLERAGLINQIARATAGRHDLSSLLNAVLTHLNDSMGIEFGAVLYCSLQSKMLVVGARVDAPGLSGPSGLAPGEVIELHNDQLRRCLEGEVLVISDSNGEEPGLIGQLKSHGIGSLMAAPLIASQVPLGILLVGRRAANSFVPADADFLRDLAQHVALALDQLRLIHDLRRACEDLRQAQQQMAQQERLRAMGQMASGIAHDINNALGPITVYSEMLLETPGLDHDTITSLEQILQAGDQIAKTVSSLRQFYRSEQDTSHHVPLDINVLVRQVVELTKPRWRNISLKTGSDIDLVLELEKNLPLLQGSDGDLKNALTNLIFNAVDAMPQGGKLTVHACKEGEHLLLRVSDTGTGMDPLTRQRCLEPFYTTKGESGSGLGLAMVYGIVDRHGGTVEIDSEIGQGSTFTMRLPLRTTDAEADAVLAPTRPARLLRILCVDDERALREALCKIMKNDGHEVTMAENGPRALEACGTPRADGEYPFDVIITDLGMPGMDGRQLAASIHAIWPKMPIILLTGWGNELVDQAIAMPEFKAILAKPPRIGEVRKALANATWPHTVGPA